MVVFATSPLRLQIKVRVGVNVSAPDVAFATQTARPEPALAGLLIDIKGLCGPFLPR
jgi:hypothetical protein